LTTIQAKRLEQIMSTEKYTVEWLRDWRPCPKVLVGTVGCKSDCPSDKKK